MSFLHFNAMSLPGKRPKRGSTRPAIQFSFLFFLPALAAAIALGIPIASAQHWTEQAEPPAPPKRPVTVKDGIELTRLADRQYFLGARSAGRVAQFSHDGKLFVMVLRRGRLASETNEYSLLLFRSAQAFDSPKPDVLLKMSSSSNRDAIGSVRWLGDSHTLLFLGENRGEVSQVFSFDIDSRRLKRLTHHPTPISSYDITADGRKLVFLADPIMNRTDCSKEEFRHGIVIADQQLADLIRDPCGRSLQFQHVGDLFVQRAGQSAEQLKVSDSIQNSGPLSLSPDGRYLLVGETVRNSPPTWSGYQAEYVQDCFSGNYRTGGRVYLNLRRYLLVDIGKGVANPLLQAPSYLRLPPAVWAADSRSVSLTKTYLPLDVTDQQELEARAKTRYDATVQIPGREYRKIEHAAVQSGPESVPLDVSLEEDFTTPVRIYVSDPRSKRKALLLNPNPQLADIDLGRVEVVEWKDSNGRAWRGGLYLPIGYTPGVRYPLVIQTHGFGTERFSIDGLNDWSSAFAARPLAAAGIAVLQAGDWSFNTTEEGPRLMAEYQGAIDYLDEKGIINRNRVGITGFSRTVYDVGYTLTHSTYHFAAAVLADGVDAGYFQFVAYNEIPDVIFLNGGKPFGEGLQSWVKNSPCFNLDRVHTPLRVLAFGASAGVLENWEWFSLLERLQKPVDFLLLPDAKHELIKPWERKTAQDGLVDWFRFWLKDEVDSDPTKLEQYARWGELRKLQ